MFNIVFILVKGYCEFIGVIILLEGCIQIVDGLVVKLNSTLYSSVNIRLGDRTRAIRL